ncbi:MAG: class I SAM-dependent methyltransferase [Vicinamibacteria bacterium]
MLDPIPAGTDPPEIPLHPASQLVDRWLGALLERAFHEAALRFELRDGTLLRGCEHPVASVVAADRTALLALLVDPEEHFGDAFVAGRIEIRGDLVAALEAAYHALERAGGRGVSRGGHSLQESRRNVHRHYDLGNDFYRLWLDERMLYTCAYFERPGLSLEAAQVAKMEHVCRKLRLAPGESVVEAGCGWGALALHMARVYGVRVRAYNVSHEQIAYAREQAERQGLTAQVEFVEEDYRRIDGGYDAFVSVGMLEHVGLGDFGTLGALIGRCLDARRGRGLLHFIGRDRPTALNAWIRHNIFPGAYPPTLAQAIERVLEPAGASVHDVENLRLHYAETLAHWLARFEAAAPEVRLRHGEEFTRAWRLYLAGSEAAFRTGSLQLFQVSFAHGAANDLPRTRAGLYGGEAQPWTAATS